MAQINIRVDETVKRNAENACAAIGMSMTTAINIFLVKLGNEMRIPFEVSADPFYSPENMARLKKSISQIESGRAIVHELIDVDVI